MSKKLSMSELIILHNELADKLGAAQEASFKSPGAARAAILVLETKLEKLMNENPTDVAVPSKVQTETTVAETTVAETTVAETTVAETTVAETTVAETTVAETEVLDVPADNSKYNSSGKRGPNQGVGAFVKALIAKGQDNATVLAAVKGQFPDAKTTTGCIAFYRNALAKAPVAKSSAVLREKAAALIAEADAIDTKTAADAKAAEAAKAAKAAEVAEAAKAAEVAEAAKAAEVAEVAEVAEAASVKPEIDVVDPTPGQEAPM
jgi:hypothetical protein